MNGSFVGAPYPCPHHVPPRECRDLGAGEWIWHDAWCALWQDVDEGGHPVGEPYEKFHHWQPTGEACAPEG